LSRFRAVLLAFAVACGDAEPARPELTFTPEALPDGRVGQDYTVAITVSANETPVYEMRVEDGSLPPGLALLYTEIQATGFIDGTPAQPGTYSFAIRASCFGTMRPGQVGTKAYSIVVR